MKLLTIALLLALLLALPMLPAVPCGVKWDSQPDAAVFPVWRGIELLATTTTNHAVVDLPADQISTLFVTATNAAGESEPSDPLTVLPVTAQSSPDLSVWKNHPVFFTERSPRHFFRFSHPLPGFPTWPHIGPIIA